MQSLEQLALNAITQSLLTARQVTHLLQLRSWRSSRGEDLPHAHRARILDTLSYGFYLGLQGGHDKNHVHEDDVAFWMEVLMQLIETAPWAPRPISLHVALHARLNERVLQNMAPHMIVALHVEGPAVCDELARAISKLPLLTTATLMCPRSDMLSEEGLSALTDSRSLTSLALTNANISERGAAALRRLTALVCLDLSGSKLSNREIKALTASSARHGTRPGPDAVPASTTKGLCNLHCLLLLDLPAYTTPSALLESGACFS